MNRCLAVVRPLTAVACLAAAGFARAQAVPPKTSPTDVVATVGDTPIFRSELDAVLRRAADAGAGAGAQDAAGDQGGGPGRRQRLEAVAIEQLVDERLLRDEIDRERITVGRTDVENRLAMLKKQVAARGMEWQRFLEQTGREENTVREQIELEIALDRLIRPKLTPAVIAAGFDRHRRELDGTRLRVSHIVLRPDAALGEEGLAKTMALAATMRREILQRGTTFADAARRHSAGPSRARGGDLGWIKRDAPLLDNFSKQAFALAKGDVSKPFVTPFGVHVVQVTDIDAGKLGIEAVRQKLESLLATNILREMLSRLRAATPVTFGPGVAHFDPLTPADGDAPRRVLVGDAPAAAAP